MPVFCKNGSLPQNQAEPESHHNGTKEYHFSVNESMRIIHGKAMKKGHWDYHGLDATIIVLNI